ncbi:MAG: hypothetical protein RBU37_17610 [Myxococcota bacterium]|nr:hypothetical protein [Myxococcota bacterium]
MQEPKTIWLEAEEGAAGDEITRRFSAALTQSRFHREATERGIADVVLSITILPVEYQLEKTTGETQKCAAKTKKGKCARWVSVPVYGYDESCHIGVEIKALAPSGNALFVKETHGSETSSVAAEGAWPASAKETICMAAFGKATEQALRWVVPTEETIKWEFHKLSNGDAQDRTEQATKYVIASNFEKAVSSFEEIIYLPDMEDEDRAWARYNHANVLFALGRFDECVESMKVAQELIGAEKRIEEMKTACTNYAR